MRTYQPMLCKLVDKPFKQEGWVWEQKLDGIRIIAYPDGSLITRQGNDVTHAFPELVGKIPPHLTLDGEIVSGTKFNNIQHRLRINNVDEAASQYPAEFKVFDILTIHGLDVSNELLIDRKKMLAGYVHESGVVSRTTFYDDGPGLFADMEARELEGVVGKKLYEPYIEGKRRWVKVKCWKTAYGLYMIVGYTPGTGWRTDTFGALVLQDLDGKPVGNVGTGFDMDTIQYLMSRFEVTTHDGNITWVKPLPVNIKYLEISKDGILRHPVYLGLEE